MLDLDRMERFIIAWIARHTGDLLYQRDRGGVALAKDRVMSAQVRAMGDVFRDKELRAVCVRTRIGIRQSPGPVKPQIGRSFILELIAGIA